MDNNNWRHTFEYMSNMKLCPFCGSKGWLMHVRFYDGDIWYNPQCSECNVIWKENYKTQKEAVSEWNKR